MHHVEDENVCREAGCEGPVVGLAARGLRALDRDCINPCPCRAAGKISNRERVLDPLEASAAMRFLKPLAEVVSDPIPKRTPRWANRRAGATALRFHVLASGV